MISHDRFYRAHYLPFPRQEIVCNFVRVKTKDSKHNNFFPKQINLSTLHHQTPTSSSYKNNSLFGKQENREKKTPKKTNFANQFAATLWIVNIFVFCWRKKCVILHSFCFHWHASFYVKYQRLVRVKLLTKVSWFCLQRKNNKKHGFTFNTFKRGCNMNISWYFKNFFWKAASKIHNHVFYC